MWTPPPHTKAKHDILTRYLQAWFGIMGSSRWISKVGVLDGFAGPGVYDNGHPGSPVLVLETLLDHASFSRWATTKFVFLFNEQDSARFAILDSTLSEFQAVRDPWPPNVVVLPPANQSFSEVAEQLLAQAETGLIPLFAFVDPFGYKDIPLDLIRRLLQYNKAELFIPTPCLHSSKTSPTAPSHHHGLCGLHRDKPPTNHGIPNAIPHNPALRIMPVMWNST